MSYLGPLRLHFAGKFQASVSTVNNDVTHFRNATFVKPTDQELQTDRDHLNGWWNPRGDADFRLIGCAVTAALDGDGKPLPGDPVMRARVADSDRAAPAKLVDLDPQQQMVSTIYGLEIRICDANGVNYVRGSFDPAPFTEINFGRGVGPGGDPGDSGAGAMYHSVITDLEWGDVSGSPFLQALQQGAADGMLSIKFNVDGYNMKYGGPEFTLGRIVGTIGPASAAEPRHFVRGRQLMAGQASTLNFCQAAVDAATSSILLDLGNALPTDGPGGPVSTQTGALALAYGNGSGFTTIGSIDYGGAGWYEATAGIVSVPASAEQLAAVADAPLALLLTRADGSQVADVIEAPSGLHVRADMFVFRIEPGVPPVAVSAYASRFGEPYPNAAVSVIFDEGALQASATQPKVATPESAVTFDAHARTDANGVATIHVQATDPGNPRGYIDGQVYALSILLDDQPASDPENTDDFVNLLVFDAFEPLDQPPTWHGTFQPIFEQYANLYPVMYTILDLADYDDVCGMRDMLLLAFGLDIANPNSMPVTRDLSSAKRKAILAWLENVGPDGKPLKGEPPAPDSELAELHRAAAVPDEARVDAELAMKGGKTAALANRIRPLSEPRRRPGA